MPASNGSGGGASGSGGGAADCPACVECVKASCQPEIDNCNTNPECAAIFECAEQCLPDGVEPCIEAHLGGLTEWSVVSQCVNEHCLEICQ